MTDPCDSEEFTETREGQPLPRARQPLRARAIVLAGSKIGDIHSLGEGASLVGRADVALHTAKESGRDCVVVFDGFDPERPAPSPRSTMKLPWSRE